MVILVTVLAGTLAAAALLGVLVREGFRNGDVDADVRVRARTLAAGDPGASGRWVEVTLTNPAPAIALVALGLRRSRLAWPTAAAERCTAPRRARLSLGERVLGAVSPRESARFHVWAEGDHRRLRLLVAVGTPGRLRLHSLPVPPPLRAGARDAGRELAAADTPAVP